MICNLSYLAISTRPDPAFPILLLSRRLHNPTLFHIQKREEYLAILQQKMLVLFLVPLRLKSSLLLKLVGAVIWKRVLLQVHLLSPSLPLQYNGKADAKRLYLCHLLKPNMWHVRLALKNCHGYVCYSGAYSTVLLGMVNLHSTTFYSFFESSLAIKLATIQQETEKTKQVELKICHVLELITKSVLSFQHVS